jgi:iron complex outermembrane receptor protein
MIKLDGDVGGKRLSGTVGVQGIYTDQSSNGSLSNFDSTTGAVIVTPASGGAKYWNVLPSANFALELAPATYLKLAGSLTMVRPRLDQERVNQEFSIRPTSVRPIQRARCSAPPAAMPLAPLQSANIDLSPSATSPRAAMSRWRSITSA